MTGKIFTITVAFGLLSFAGCCRKPVSAHTADSVKIAVHTEYIERLRDTTVYVRVPSEERSAIVRDSSFLETAAASSKARINADGTLYHDLRAKPQRIPVEVQVKDTYRTDSEQTEEVHSRTVTVAAEKSLSGFQSFLIWSGVGLWLILAVALGYKLLKR